MRRLFAFSVVLALVTACSGKKDAPAGASFPDRDSFCHEWGVRNCVPAVIDACLAGTADKCVAGAEANCKTKIPDGKYSSKDAEACLAAVDGAYADKEISIDERAVLIDFGGPCGTILSGSTGKDGSCAEDSDCNREEGLECVIKAGHASGLCETAKLIDNGGNCSADDAVCSEGYYCDSGNHCVEGGAENSPCSASEPCGKGLRCPVSTGAASDGGVGSACVKLSQKSDPCENDSECESNICVLADPKTNAYKCDDHIPLVAGSAICTSIQ